MLSVTRDILIQAPQEAVAVYLRDVTHLPQYERKVQSCRVSYPRQDAALAQVKGRYAGLRWAGIFELRFTPDGGFQSSMTSGPVKRMFGSYRVERVDGGVRLTHTETYGFSFPMRLLSPLLHFWVSRQVEKELTSIKRQVERA